MLFFAPPFFVLPFGAVPLLPEPVPIQGRERLGAFLLAPPLAFATAAFAMPKLTGALPAPPILLSIISKRLLIAGSTTPLFFSMPSLICSGILAPRLSQVPAITDHASFSPIKLPKYDNASSAEPDTAAKASISLMPSPNASVVSMPDFSSSAANSCISDCIPPRPALKIPESASLVVSGISTLSSASFTISSIAHFIASTCIPWPTASLKRPDISVPNFSIAVFASG